MNPPTRIVSLRKIFTPVGSPSLLPFEGMCHKDARKCVQIRSFPVFSAGRSVGAHAGQTDPRIFERSGTAKDTRIISHRALQITTLAIGDERD
jgi:hypothetical protein